jgi:hypothetical protein
MWVNEGAGERFCKELAEVVQKGRKDRLKWERLLITLGAEVRGAGARLQTILTRQDQQRLRREIKRAMEELDLLPTHAAAINVRREERSLDRMAVDLLSDLRMVGHFVEDATILKVVGDAVTLYVEIRRLVGRKILVLTKELPCSRPEALMNGDNPKRFSKRLIEIAEILKIVVPQR